MSENSDPEPRTHYEACVGLQYNERLHFRQARVFRRVQALLAVLSGVAGSAALLEAMRGHPRALAALGVVVAVVAILDRVLGLERRAMQHLALHKRYAQLRSRSATLSLEQLDAECALIDAEADDEIEGLRIPAMNDVMRQNGHDDAVRRETLWMRVVALIG